ncbi:tetratricopeptide repeat protein [Salinimicrobium xinjiangense]|uniref:tetratricopeptide repeat protein n=1 Tax=Salinimicrobium xinjiangense TaxID=438596 RepID=UPI0004004EEE|nr:hypothetical protein [Salinimicrobium xinjiangense]
MGFFSFFKELKRRNVYKVGTVYAITAWLIAQVFSIATDAFAAPAWVMKMLIIILIAGFPIALIFAWAFEMTPDGLRRTTAASYGTVPAKKGLKLNIWIIGLLAVALLLLGAERVFFAESTFSNTGNDKVKASIAVLPFADFSPEKDQEYFADGISEQILNSLAKVEGVQVAGRSSSFQFKNENRDLKKIGDSLGVNHLLEGSVRKAGNNLRITAQLIKADNGFHIWTETYDKTFSANDIFEIQDEIAFEVLQALKVHILVSEKENLPSRPTENVEAYQLYLKGRSVSQRFNPEDLEKAMEFYDRAIELDPEFALAYAKKARVLVLLNIFGNLSNNEMLQRSREAVNWALVLNKDLPEAYAALGLIHWASENYSLSTAAYKLASSLKPGDGEIYAEIAMPLLNENKTEEAFRNLSKAYRLDPLSPLVNLNFGWHYFYKENYAMSKEHFMKAIELEPELLAAYDGLSLIAMNQGLIGDAFITGYKSLHGINKKNAWIYEGLYQHALTLGLDSLKNKYYNILRTNFPNNIYSYYAKVEKLMEEGQYEQVIKYTSDYELKNGGIHSDRALETMTAALLQMKKSKEALEVIKQRYPIALNPDTTNYANRNLAVVNYAALAYLQLGKREKALQLLNTVCKYSEERLKENDRTTTVYDWHLAACSGLLGNKEKTIAFLKNRLENRQLHQHHYVYGTFNDLFLRLSEEELKPYLRQEKEIFKRQREKVIAFLNEKKDFSD